MKKLITLFTGVLFAFTVNAFAEAPKTVTKAEVKKPVVAEVKAPAAAPVAEKKDVAAPKAEKKMKTKKHVKKEKVVKTPEQPK